MSEPELTKVKIMSRCSLCGYESELSDAAGRDAHMAEAHGMYFDPRSLAEVVRFIPRRTTAEG